MARQLTLILETKKATNFAKYKPDRIFKRTSTIGPTSTDKWLVPWGFASKAVSAFETDKPRRLEELGKGWEQWKDTPYQTLTDMTDDLTDEALQMDVGAALVIAAALSGGDVDYTSGETGPTALHYAVGFAKFEIIKELVKRGANLNKRVCDHRPFDMAFVIEGGEYSVIEFDEIHRQCVLGNVDAVVDHIKQENFDSVEKCTDLLVKREMTLYIAAFMGYERLVATLLLAGVFPFTSPSDKYPKMYGKIKPLGEFQHEKCNDLLKKSGQPIYIKSNIAFDVITLAATISVLAILVTVIGPPLLSSYALKVVNHAFMYKVPITPHGTVLVVGQKENGKTTLIKALQRSTDFIQIAKWFKIKNTDVYDRTAGIEISLLKCGDRTINFFDFAGHSEYYVSHLAFLESISYSKLSPPVVLLVIRLNKSLVETHSEISTWLENIRANSQMFHKFPVILVGTHCDMVAEEEAEGVLTSCSDLIGRYDDTFELQSTFSLDATLKYSDEFGDLVANLKSVLSRESHISTDYFTFKCLSSCYTFLSFLEKSNFKEAVIQIKDIKNLITAHPLLLEREFLTFLCQNLAAFGLAIYLPNKVDVLDGWLVLDAPSILEKVHGPLFATAEHSQYEGNVIDKNGLMPISKLPSLFRKLPFDFDMLKSLLISMEYCHEVDRTILDIPQSEYRENETLLFFPSKVRVSMPDEISKLLEQQNLKWFACQVCPKDNALLTARFSSILLLSLALGFRKLIPGKDDDQNAKCTVWKDGLHWSSSFGSTDVYIQFQSTKSLLILVSGESLEFCVEYSSYIMKKVFEMRKRALCNVSLDVNIVQHDSKLTSLLLKGYEKGHCYPLGRVITCLCAFANRQPGSHEASSLPEVPLCCCKREECQIHSTRMEQEYLENLLPSYNWLCQLDPTADPPSLPFNLIAKRATTESILRPNYTRLGADLDIKGVCDYLYQDQLIEVNIKEKIEKSTRQEANKLFIDHMIANCTISTVEHFAQLLIDTSDKLANEVHKGIGEELVGAIEKQRKMVEHMTSSVTPSLSISNES